VNKLYLVRHAKSSWEDKSLSDEQRPLNKRGRKSVLEMGSRLTIAGIQVDLIISSHALRAITTARSLAAALGYDEESIQQNRQLYFEGESAMLKVIQKTPPEIQSLMLVGHNPNMTALLNYLCGYQTDNMPTCAIATIQLKHGWPDVTRETGVLIDYDFPKNSN